ncbi:MAG: hypothetical protein K2I44_03145, partial [Muribaculaceae bacterium]|nr:hypothetical protein [Muribaculaceae bacterium]
MLYSFASAFFLLVLTYFVDSSPFPIGGEASIGQWVDRIEYIITRNSDNVPDSVCLINVAYDKVLVEYEAKLYRDDEDSPTLPVGQIDVTDRDKLLRFLEIADSVDSYRYIMLDVRFDDDVETDSITMKLFSQIKKMDRIVYAIHQDSEPNTDAPIEKAAFGDYHTTFLASDVVKYPVCKTNQDGIFISSMPARMYEELNNREIMAYGWFTFDNGHLCVRSIYPSYPVRFYNWGKIQDYNQETILQYFNLGEDFLNSTAPHDLIENSIENRIVIIGDFVEDIHDTFYGQL